MFMKKASARLASQAGSAKITVLASHAESMLRDFCTTGLVLIDGQLRFLGPLEDALDYYNKLYA